MNDNLPEINFKEKKEKKKGALGWLRNRLGLGSRGAMGEAGINPAAMNVGRALGSGGFGSSAGLAGLLAGKAGLLATIAMIAVAGGIYLAHNSPDVTSNSGAFSSNKSQDNYVPAILRSQSANQGSSLDMFKDTNKGAGLAMEGDGAKAAADKAAADKAAADAKAAAGDEAKPQDQAAPGNDMAQGMMSKLQGGNMASMTSSLGGGSSKFSNMGGFGNKFGQGATGAKAGFGSGIGSGFSAMPKFDQRKGKMLAMKGSARPVFSGSKAGKRGAFGTGAFSQAKGLKATQKAYTGTSADSARSTQDKAWEGSTPDGATGGSGAGLSDGGAGVVTSPSLDNTGSSGGGGDTGTSSEPTVAEAPAPTNVSPWKSLTMMAMMLILMSAVLSGIGAKLITMGDAMIKEGTAMEAVFYTAPAGAAMVASGTALRGMGMALCGVAIALGAAAVIMGIMIMTSFGQKMLGTIYTIGGGVAIGAAAMAMTGTSIGPITPMVMSAAAGVIALIGSMLGGK